MERLSDAVAALAEAVKVWSPGDPLVPATRLGPLSSPGHLARVDAAVARALSEGARMCAQNQNPAPEYGAFFRPVVLDNVAPGDWIAQEEVFGPVLAVIGYRHIEEAIAIANAVPYGLSASIASEDVELASHVAARLRAGLVNVALAPGATPANAADLAVEPRGLSGFGAEGGRPGLEGYGRLKLVNVSAPR
jgi:acyl-CoA reductase-like NAD-dependent aldehyde dehydrogenase